MSEMQRLRTEENNSVHAALCLVCTFSSGTLSLANKCARLDLIIVNPIEITTLSHSRACAINIHEQTSRDLQLAVRIIGALKWEINTYNVLPSNV